MGESRGDINLISGNTFAVIENKVKGAACSEGQLKRHLAGARDLKGHRRAVVIVISPPDAPKWLAEECGDLGEFGKTTDWRKLVGVLREVYRYAKASDSRMFLGAYIRYVEKQVLKEWDHFQTARLTKRAVRAAADWAEHGVGLRDELERFLDAVDTRADHGTSRSLLSMDAPRRQLPMSPEAIVCTPAVGYPRSPRTNLRFG